MISNMTPPGTMFLRSLAINGPLFLGTGAVLAGVFAGVAKLSREADVRLNNRSFLRSIAANEEISHDLLLFYENSDDPVREALRALANPDTSDPVRTALRAALAVSL